MISKECITGRIWVSICNPLLCHTVNLIAMLLKALKSNQPFYFLLIPLVAVIFWIKSLITPVAYPFFQGEDMMILYQPVSFLLGKSPLASGIVALFFVILLVFLILKLNIQYAFIRGRSFLPSSLFIIIISGLHELHSMHPVYFAALFLILAIDRIFNSYEKEVIHSNAFESAIFLAIGSLFYLNLIFFFPILWIGFIIVKPKVNWREFVITIIGFIFPWAAAFTYYAATDQIEELSRLLISNLTFHQVFLKGNLPVQIYIGFLVFLTLLGSIFIVGQYDEKKISSRKYFKTFFWIFLIASVLVFVVPSVSQEIVLLLAIPLTYLIANYLIYMKRQIWGELFFYILVAGVIYLQFI